MLINNFVLVSGYLRFLYEKLYSFRVMVNFKKKQIMFDGKFLFQKNSNGIEKLGTITTHKGALTRAQKIQAVANNGEWIEV